MRLGGGTLRRVYQFFRDAFLKCDKILLLLCLVTNAFGMLVIASATNANARGSFRYLLIQGAAAFLGIILYLLFSSIDTDAFSERRRWLIGFNTFILLLLIPFGVDHDSGNRSWIALPGFPVDIQPAEICKITFVLIIASVMAAQQNKRSSIPSVANLALQLGLVAGLNLALSKDAGVSLIFVFIFIGMAFAGGINMIWFLVAAGGIAVAAPIAWQYVLSPHQKNRIMVLFDPSLDPNGINERYHTVRSLRSLTGGGLTGQGLFHGTRTQTEGALFAQHTDYIFSAIGEELGFFGCFLAIGLLAAIVIRCIQVGMRSPDYMRQLVCFGCATALIFQIVSNVGMCIGVTPVIGLTLPFISYGGSSLVSLYAMMGLVSGVYARPSPTSHERYIHPPYQYL